MLITNKSINLYNNNKNRITPKQTYLKSEVDTVQVNFKNNSDTDNKTSKKSKLPFQDRHPTLNNFLGCSAIMLLLAGYFLILTKFNIKVSPLDP